MLKKIIVNNKQYTVDLLTAKEVIKAIPKNFIYSDSSGEYEFNKLTSYEKDSFILPAVKPRPSGREYQAVKLKA